MPDYNDTLANTGLPDYGGRRLFTGYMGGATNIDPSTGMPREKQIPQYLIQLRLNANNNLLKNKVKEMESLSAVQEKNRLAKERLKEYEKLRQSDGAITGSTNLPSTRNKLNKPMKKPSQFESNMWYKKRRQKLNPVQSKSESFKGGTQRQPKKEKEIEKRTRSTTGRKLISQEGLRQRLLERRKAKKVEFNERKKIKHVGDTTQDQPKKQVKKRVYRRT